MEDKGIYKINTNSNEHDNIQIEIKKKENNLDLNLFYIENFLKKTYIGNFSLEDLKKKSDYFIQFNDPQMIIEEIKGYKGNKKIEINEKDDKITLKFPVPSVTFENIEFILTLQPKSNEKKIEECEKVLKQLTNILYISEFKSKILKDSKSKKYIKNWISPFAHLSAKLIYSFYIESDEDFEKLGKFGNRQYKNFRDVTNFHKKCDGIPNLLVLCKSKNEIFGGFTPLKFSSEDTYGYDNDSFLFSINNLKKYPKNDQNSNRSIWNYKNYGPCFSYDLCFLENSMNNIKFTKYRYAISEKFINKKNSYFEDYYIILDSLEIFEIKIIDKNLNI